VLGAYLGILDAALFEAEARPMVNEAWKAPRVEGLERVGARSGLNFPLHLADTCDEVAAWSGGAIKTIRLCYREMFPRRL